MGRWRSGGGGLQKFSSYVIGFGREHSKTHRASRSTPGAYSAEWEEGLWPCPFTVVSEGRTKWSKISRPVDVMVNPHRGHEWV